MRLATVMMSLRLAGALTFAPEPIVMATSFSVRVWQICTWKFYILLKKWLNMDRWGNKTVILPSGWRCSVKPVRWGRKSYRISFVCDTEGWNQACKTYEASSIQSSFSKMASMWGLVMTTSSSSSSEGSLWVSMAPIRSTVGLSNKQEKRKHDWIAN